MIRWEGGQIDSVEGVGGVQTGGRAVSSCERGADKKENSEKDSGERTTTTTAAAAAAEQQQRQNQQTDPPDYSHRSTDARRLR